jgi:hypothetical protein
MGITALSLENITGTVTAQFSLINEGDFTKRQRKMVKWGLFIVIVVYNALDVWQTHLLVLVGAKEINPIINFFVGYIGLIPAIIGLKIFFLSILGVLLYNYKKEV